MGNVKKSLLTKILSYSSSGESAPGAADEGPPSMGLMNLEVRSGSLACTLKGGDLGPHVEKTTGVRGCLQAEAFTLTLECLLP